MRIAHLCLSNFYIDGVAYQENHLVHQHLLQGHDVLVVASTENFDENKKVTYGYPDDYVGSDGARVIRLPYRLWPHRLARKLRVHSKVDLILEEFAPDVILFHGTCGWEIRTAATYARLHPEVDFYIDSHEDWNNSARSFLSRELLHRLFYGPVLRSTVDACEKILCLSTEVIEFVADLYKVDRAKLELFPLGCAVLDDDDFQQRRGKTREYLGANPDTAIFIQSGKQTVRKKLIEALEAFKAAAPVDTLFLIAGILDADIKSIATNLIASDPRICFLGWCDTEKLTDLLCAADIYVQPGTQSATMQHSLGCRCAVILDDVPAHTYYKCQNGWLVSTQVELEEAIRDACCATLPAMAKNSFDFATTKLDYSMLARRIASQVRK